MEEGLLNTKIEHELKVGFWKWAAFEEIVGYMHHLGWRVWNKILGLDPSDLCIAFNSDSYSDLSDDSSLEKEFPNSEKAEMIVWQHRNGWCCWGKLNHCDIALWHSFLLDLKRETQLSWFSLLFQVPSYLIPKLMFSSLPAALIFFLVLLLNSAIVVLKSAKCFGYSLYVGCCTKLSCVSVWWCNENTL